MTCSILDESPLDSLHGSTMADLTSTSGPSVTFDVKDKGGENAQSMAIDREGEEKSITSFMSSPAQQLIDEEKQPQQHPAPQPLTKNQKAYSITEQVFAEIHHKIGKHKPELGGMLGGSRKDRTVTHFYFDSGADTSAGTYSPDTATLNQVVKAWNDAGIDLVGMIHSHPNFFIRPSYGDEIYARAFLKACKEMDDFFMPIVQTEQSGYFEVRGYVVSRHHSGQHRLSPVDYCLI